MTTPSTSLTYDMIRRAIGREMGWSRDPGDWSADEVQDAADMIAHGCRVAYYPPDYQWRFLRVPFAITTASGVREYPLPPDCNAVVGPLLYSENDGNSTEVRIVAEAAIRGRYQNQSLTSTGYPIDAAVLFERPTTESPSRSMLVVWPEPDGVYTLHGACIAQPGTITAAQQYPYGTAAFHECLLNAILAQCEMRLGENDGKYAMAFREQMANARRLDEFSSPDTLGYNGDGSDGPVWTRRDLRPGRVVYGDYG